MIHASTAKIQERQVGIDLGSQKVGGKGWGEGRGKHTSRRVGERERERRGWGGCRPS
jgi:hypothetical protein